MEILEVIHGKLNLARRVLHELIDNYKHLEDTPRLEKTTTIMDAINSYLQLEENLIFPYIRKTGEHDDLIDRAKSVHEQIENIIEHTINIHVDEPSGEYYDNLVRLLTLLEQAAKVDEDAIIPWARVYLSSTDQEYIARHLKEQMTHESLPSSGQTIY